MEGPMIMKTIPLSKRWRSLWRRTKRKPPLKAPVQAGFTGIEETHRPAEEALFDIVCVHGLEGNQTRTWTTNADKLWPGWSLGKQLPKCRMLEYGYSIKHETLLDSSLDRTIDELASKLLENVARDRKKSTPDWKPVSTIPRIQRAENLIAKKSRPIVLVGHGLGGLICQHATTLINGPDHLKKTAQLIHGVILLATPHSRAGLTQWAAIAARSMGLTKKEVAKMRTMFEKGVDHIVERQRLFREMVEAADSPSETSERGRIKVVSCFESRDPGKQKRVIADEQRIPPEFAITPYSKPIQAHGISDERQGLANFEAEDGRSGFEVLAKELSAWSQQMESSTNKLPKKLYGERIRTHSEIVHAPR